MTDNNRITCNFCPSDFFTTADYNTHQKYHKLSRNIPCKQCGSILKNYESFKSHTYFHRTKAPKRLSNELVPLINPDINFKCKQCDIETKTLNQLIEHSSVHIEIDRKNLQCVEPNCSQYFQNVAGLRSHVYRKHNPTKKLKIFEINTISDANFPEEEHIQQEESHIIEPHPTTFYKKTLTHEYGLCLLDLYAHKNISVEVIQTIVDNLKNIEQSIKENMTEKISKTLITCNVNPLTIQTVLDDISNSEDLSIFADKNFKSHKLRLKYFKGSKWYVEPEEKVVLLPGSSKKYIYHCVSVTKTLEKLLQITEVKNSIINPDKNREPSIIKGFEDGRCFLTNDFFKKYPNAFQIEIYADGYNLCDPTRPSKGRHNLHGVYFRLGNCPEFFSSRIDRLQLIMLVNSKLLKKAGIDKIFQPLLDEIIQLERGVMFPGFESPLYGTISFFGTDNLGMLKRFFLIYKNK